MSAAKFEIGNLVITKGARLKATELFGDKGSALTKLTIMLARHAQGDWGDLNKWGKLTNDSNLKNGGQLFSAYEVLGVAEFWIITTPDRSKTTISIPTDIAH